MPPQDEAALSPDAVSKVRPFRENRIIALLFSRSVRHYP